MSLLKVETTRFGTLEVSEDKVIYFPKGIFGFPQLTRYIYLDRGEQDGPFAWLQAVEDPDVAFIVIDPRLLKPDYSVRVSAGEVEELQLKDPSQAQIFVIVNVPGQLQNATANLCGPLIINPAKRLGMQLVLDNDQYPLRYPIFGSSVKTEVVG